MPAQTNAAITVNGSAVAAGAMASVTISITNQSGGCGFAFADGHSESHQWRKGGEKLRHTFNITDPLDRQDWEWMRQPTSAYAKGDRPLPQ